MGNFSGACIRWTAKLMKVMAYFLKLPPALQMHVLSITRAENEVTSKQFDSL